MGTAVLFLHEQWHSIGMRLYIRQPACCAPPQPACWRSYHGVAGSQTYAGAGLHTVSCHLVQKTACSFLPGLWWCGSHAPGSLMGPKWGGVPTSTSFLFPNDPSWCSNCHWVEPPTNAPNPIINPIRHAKSHVVLCPCSSERCTLTAQKYASCQWKYQDAWWSPHLSPWLHCHPPCRPFSWPDPFYYASPLLPLEQGRPQQSCPQKASIQIYM